VKHNIAKTRRMQHIFREDGRSLIVAMDHGTYMNVLPQAADPGKLIKEFRAGGADAVLTTMGIASTYAQEIGPLSLILRVDGSGSHLDRSMSFDQRFTVENALRLGADAVAVMGFPGVNDDETLRTLAHVASQCDEWNMPLLGEMLPGGFDPSFHTPENITVSARIGAELGADIIKTTYTGDIASFKTLTSGVFCPVVVLGGGRKESDEELLQMVHDSIQAGASGVAVGRNVWQHGNVRGIVSALAAVIHEGATVKQALERLHTFA